MNEFSDAALLLVGHGSSAGPDAAAPVYQHGAELRRRQVFAAVSVAFWKQEPSIPSALEQLVQQRVFVVPLLMSEGYFADEVIPRELGFGQAKPGGFGRMQERDGRAIYYCPPVGTHSTMAGVIMARAAEVVQKHPFPVAPRPEQTALVLGAHGTERHEQSRKAVEGQAARIKAANRYAEVHTVFLEEEPRIGRCFELTRVRNVVLVPFFLSDGPHTTQDIPVLLGEPERLVRQRLEQGQPTWRNPTERQGKLLWYARSAGTDPHVAEVILQLVADTARTFGGSESRPSAA